MYEQEGYSYEYGYETIAAGSSAAPHHVVVLEEGEGEGDAGAQPSHTPLALLGGQQCRWNVPEKSIWRVDSCLVGCRFVELHLRAKGAVRGGRAGITDESLQ